MVPFTDETKVEWHGRDQDLHSGLSNAQIRVLSITQHFVIKGEPIQGNVCSICNYQCVNLKRNNAV